MQPGPLVLSTADAAEPLPPLRPELRLLPGRARPDGSPTWILHDPLREKFFHIGWLEYELLARWHLVKGQAVLRAVEAESTCPIEPQHLHQLVTFLRHHHLVQPIGRETLAILATRMADKNRPLWQSVLHHYLMFRVRLFCPDPLLSATSRVTGLFLQVLTCRLLAVGGVIAGLLLLQHWPVFWATATDLATPAALLPITLALMVTKIVHELGHAIVAHHAGCRVSAMGIAFILFFPLPYTDTSDTWRLTDPRGRRAVAAAGIGAELCLAIVAVYAWVLLPDGPLRQMAFLIAGVSLMTSIVVNLNPLFRFDGYYILSDWLDLPNLQERAFALARWAMREVLFGFCAAPPEPWRPAHRAGLIAFGCATYFYRLILFLGFALAVYQFAFKLLGLFLAGFEIVWFIIRPMVREVGLWWERRGAMRWNRSTARTLLVIGGLSAILVTPWPGSTDLPALLVPARTVVLFPPDASRIVRVHVVQDQTVAAGDVLFELESPDLAFHLNRTALAITRLRVQINQIPSDPTMLDRARILEEALLEAETELDGHQARLAQLRVAAPFSGRIADLPRGLQVGRWLSRGEPLATLVDTSRVQIEAFVTEGDPVPLPAGTEGTFYPDDLAQSPQSAVLERVETASLGVLARPQVASIYGGAVPVRVDGQGRLVPIDGLYRAVFRVKDDRAPSAIDRELRGVVKVPTAPRSWLGQGGHVLLQVLVREHGL